MAEKMTPLKKHLALVEERKANMNNRQDSTMTLEGLAGEVLKALRWALLNLPVFRSGLICSFASL